MDPALLCMSVLACVQSVRTWLRSMAPYRTARCLASWSVILGWLIDWLNSLWSRPFSFHCCITDWAAAAAADDDADDDLPYIMGCVRLRPVMGLVFELSGGGLGGLNPSSLPNPHQIAKLYPALRLLRLAIHHWPRSSFLTIQTVTGHSPP